MLERHAARSPPRKRGSWLRTSPKLDHNPADGDLRKPSLHTIYNQHRDRGLTSLLEGDQSVAAAAEPTLVEHLDLVTTGPDTANPAELLASHRLAEILEEARKLYEIIIIDSPVPL